MKQLLSILLLSIFFCSCTPKYAIEGNTAMSNMDGKIIFLKVYQNNQWLAVDSAEVIHGFFTMKGQVDSVAMATLFLDNQSIMPLILENGKIKISLAYNDLSARGTSMNDLLYNFLDKRQEIENRLYELERSETRLILEGRGLDEVKAEILQKSEVIGKEMTTLVKDFIVSNGENVLGPYVFILLGTSMPYPILTPQIEDIINAAPYALKNNPLVKEYIKTAKENKELINEQQRMSE
ncbi:DUF4369 domain-containing protein [Bacteroides sp. 519]|uniref:DUF4369 domain-containing protein n=1 Tax=Bacteroides sp. 519 TaxID=2302937 RepID=UPI0013D0CD46|nr:DUF4369 domain-containing protein [Bacteroides sp. 519]NDV59724.1 DUF4369 domain-containing protein [Bacteroides sp. 519]